ncbi:FAD dependent oxidoreductase [Ancylostoma duodenale]|uniref:FAD dependent oxidoreductase n=1 Tax=Ancylostoma duodenale TaxID=51022 RepID=A0A0C2GT64_9BILA|nr:FAD dependent oxidoreductase [Ancylostoma duodenale]
MCSAAETSRSTCAAPKKIAVIGEGVIGLSTATAIKQRDPTVQITVFHDRPFQSILSRGIAGLFRIGQPTPIQRLYGNETFVHLAELWRTLGGFSGVQLLSGHIMSEDENSLRDQERAYGDIVYNFRFLSDEEKRSQFSSSHLEESSVIHYTAFTSEGAKYCPWMKKELIAKGVDFVQRKIDNLDEVLGVLSERERGESQRGRVPAELDKEEDLVGGNLPGSISRFPARSKARPHNWHSGTRAGRPAAEKPAQPVLDAPLSRIWRAAQPVTRIRPPFGRKSCAVGPIKPTARLVSRLSRFFGGRWAGASTRASDDLLACCRYRTAILLADEGFEVVVNCAGLDGGRLAGDPNDTFPIRGILLKVDAPWQKHFFFRDFITFTIPTIDAVYVGTVKEDYEDSMTITKNETNKLWCRYLSLQPAFKNVKVLDHFVGLRPGRSSVRVEAEMRKTEKGTEYKVVHNYGHGGSGFTIGWGTALHASALVFDLPTTEYDEALADTAALEKLTKAAEEAKAAAKSRVARSVTH